MSANIDGMITNNAWQRVKDNLAVNRGQDPTTLAPAPPPPAEEEAGPTLEGMTANTVNLLKAATMEFEKEVKFGQ